jgi:hypothetical protein
MPLIERYNTLKKRYADWVPPNSRSHDEYIDLVDNDSNINLSRRRYAGALLNPTEEALITAALNERETIDDPGFNRNVGSMEFNIGDGEDPVYGAGTSHNLVAGEGNRPLHGERFAYRDALTNMVKKAHVKRIQDRLNADDIPAIYHSFMNAHDLYPIVPNNLLNQATVQEFGNHNHALPVNNADQFMQIANNSQRLITNPNSDVAEEYRYPLNELASIKGFSERIPCVHPNGPHAGDDSCTNYFSRHFADHPNSEFIYSVPTGVNQSQDLGRQYRAARSVLNRMNGLRNNITNNGGEWRGWRINDNPAINHPFVYNANFAHNNNTPARLFANLLPDNAGAQQQIPAIYQAYPELANM